MIIDRYRQIVDRRIDDRGCGPVTAAMAVADLVFKTGFAKVIGYRCEQHRIVVEMTSAAMQGIANGN